MDCLSHALTSAAENQEPGAVEAFLAFNLRFHFYYKSYAKSDSNKRLLPADFISFWQKFVDRDKAVVMANRGSFKDVVIGYLQERNFPFSTFISSRGYDLDSFNEMVLARAPEIIKEERSGGSTLKLLEYRLHPSASFSDSEHKSSDEHKDDSDFDIEEQNAIKNFFVRQYHKIRLSSTFTKTICMIFFAFALISLISYYYFRSSVNLFSEEIQEQGRGKKNQHARDLRGAGFGAKAKMGFHKSSDFKERHESQPKSELREKLFDDSLLDSRKKKQTFLFYGDIDSAQLVSLTEESEAILAGTILLPFGVSMRELEDESRHKSIFTDLQDSSLLPVEVHVAAKDMPKLQRLFDRIKRVYDKDLRISSFHPIYEKNSLGHPIFDSSFAISIRVPFDLSESLSNFLRHDEVPIAEINRLRGQDPILDALIDRADVVSGGKRLRHFDENSLFSFLQGSFPGATDRQRENIQKFKARLELAKPQSSLSIMKRQPSTSEWGTRPLKKKDDEEKKIFSQSNIATVDRPLGDACPNKFCKLSNCPFFHKGVDKKMKYVPGKSFDSPLPTSNIYTVLEEIPDEIDLPKPSELIAEQRAFKSLPMAGAVRVCTANGRSFVSGAFLTPAGVLISTHSVFATLNDNITFAVEAYQFKVFYEDELGAMVWLPLNLTGRYIFLTGADPTRANISQAAVLEVDTKKTKHYNRLMAQINAGGHFSKPPVGITQNLTMLSCQDPLRPMHIHIQQSRISDKGFLYSDFDTAFGESGCAYFSSTGEVNPDTGVTTGICSLVAVHHGRSIGDATNRAIAYILTPVDRAIIMSNLAFERSHEFYGVGESINRALTSVGATISDSIPDPKNL